MTAADEAQRSEFGAAWTAANTAAQRLARAATSMARNLHQGRIPTRTETEHVRETTAKLMDAMDALNRLESNRHDRT
ncbi:hypothetical protein [Actinomadura luteofluorescens]|uniref:hypothetical protein n=1 Tax=Actinomadura luteofluorescens TaxID=46163 RepID=UPI003D8FDE6E